MSAKIIALIVGALGLGFTGTYFGTSGGGNCSGGCPISNLFSSESSNTSTDCCNPASECCTPPQACCGEAKVKTATVSTESNCPHGCCFEGSSCCADPAACPHGCCGANADCCTTVKKK